MTKSAYSRIQGDLEVLFGPRSALPVCDCGENCTRSDSIFDHFNIVEYHRDPGMLFDLEQIGARQLLRIAKYINRGFVFTNLSAVVILKAKQVLVEWSDISAHYPQAMPYVSYTI